VFQELKKSETIRKTLSKKSVESLDDFRENFIDNG
jgi:hypothetical protein